MSTSLRKIAVITGASSGIGAVYADRFAKRGYDLVLVARRAERLKALAETISKTHGVSVEPFVADLATDEGQASVAQVLATNPAVSVLVNNAGSARLAPIIGSPLEDSLSQIALNITALTRLTHAALPGMKARNEGLIINIASALSLHSLPISSVYSGTKAFVLNFSRGLQQEVADTSVKIQVVLPAATATELWDQSGVPLAALNPETVMATDAMVDAALIALDKGESITLPSVADAELIERFETARAALFASTNTGKVAPRLLPA
ncbi:SDR family oxidoreductase [Methylobacillus gramineus]|uniref:SDR family NAD(P)-dependent oxidoreductase n=1 Tax=Methylobacillus gramineus TaxID=755169 RepID=UPI001CFFD808|nr:SDR family oxidoreductase [Methylobacillus gramineus]MCB5185009.1 SDR family oxidoreductase [Methylobacillus gramineus]